MPRVFIDRFDEAAGTRERAEADDDDSRVTLFLVGVVGAGADVSQAKSLNI